MYEDLKKVIARDKIKSLENINNEVKDSSEKVDGKFSLDETEDLDLTQNNSQLEKTSEMDHSDKSDNDIIISAQTEKHNHSLLLLVPCG